jgi:hypothetical protein
MRVLFLLSEPVDLDHVSGERSGDEYGAAIFEASKALAAGNQFLDGESNHEALGFRAKGHRCQGGRTENDAATTQRGRSTGNRVRLGSAATIQAT